MFNMFFFKFYLIRQYLENNMEQQEWTQHALTEYTVLFRTPFNASLSVCLLFFS